MSGVRSPVRQVAWHLSLKGSLHLGGALKFHCQVLPKKYSSRSLALMSGCQPPEPEVHRQSGEGVTRGMLRVLAQALRPPGGVRMCRVSLWRRPTRERSELL